MIEDNESLSHGHMINGGCQKLVYGSEEVYLPHRVSTCPGTGDRLPGLPPLPSSCTRSEHLQQNPQDVSPPLVHLRPVGLRLVPRCC